jgi:hypothetical protein
MKNIIRNLNEFDNSKPFKVYRNLNKKGWFSIIGYHLKKKSYLLYAHANNFKANNIEFKVSEAGRQRVLSNQKRNVHAFAHCMGLELDNSNVEYSRDNKVSYNPYKHGNFYMKHTGEIINEANSIFVTNNEIFVLD